MNLMCPHEWVIIRPADPHVFRYRKCRYCGNREARIYSGVDAEGMSNIAWIRFPDFAVEEEGMAMECRHANTVWRKYFPEDELFLSCEDCNDVIETNKEPSDGQSI